jgi:choline-sulfatase
MHMEPVPETPQRTPFARRALVALCGALVFALIAAVSVALHDAARFKAPVLETSGLIFPLGAVICLLVGLWVSLLHPQPPLLDLKDMLASQRARIALLLAGLGLVVAWVLIGQVSMRMLTAFSDQPRKGGVLTAAVSLALVFLILAATDRVATLLAPRLRALRAGTALSMAILIPALLAFLLVLLGNTSGVGTPFALFGVFRRQELDLFPVVHVLLIVAATYAGAYLSRKGPMQVWGALALAALAFGVFGFYQASRLDLREAVSVERSRGVGALVLARARKLSDADGDGYSSRFGGGDCDDNNPNAHPGAVDIPDNNVDEDCRGGDKKLVSEGSTEAESAKQEPTAHLLPEAPNVLLLTIDTMRWDLGFMSEKARAGVSPRLDALAARSTVFEYAYSLASYTSKSLGPMMVGRYPSETKRTFEHFDRFSKDVPLLQERIQMAGIHTTSVQGYWYFFFKGYGFERGWDVLDSTSAPKAVLIEGDKSSNGDKLADRTISHLGELRDSGKRFFMWTHWVDPHTEYVPHEGFDFGSEPRERYDGEIAFVDHHVGRILNSLEELGLSKNTIVIVTSDHGEAFGEHGMIRHGFEVWDVLVRVPLIVHVPGVPPRRVAERRSLIDVAPTILEAFSIEVAGTDDDFIRGRSLFRDVLAPSDAQLDVRPVLVDMAEGPHNKERRAFYQGDLKLITTNGRVLGLYDVKNDPEELQDLSDQKDKLSQVERAMNGYLDTLHEVPATR